MRRVVRRRTGWRSRISIGVAAATKFPQILPPPGGRPEGGRRAGAAGPEVPSPLPEGRPPRPDRRGAREGGGPANTGNGADRRANASRSDPPRRSGRAYATEDGAEEPWSHSGRRVRSAGWARPAGPAERGSSGREAGRRRAGCGERVVDRRGEAVDRAIEGRRRREGRRGTHGTNASPTPSPGSFLPP